MLDYIVNSTLWSAGGLVLGYVLGRIDADVTRIRRRLAHDHAGKTPPPPAD